VFQFDDGHAYPIRTGSGIAYLSPGPYDPALDQRFRLPLTGAQRRLGDPRPSALPLAGSVLDLPRIAPSFRRDGSSAMPSIHLCIALSRPVAVRPPEAFDLRSADALRAKTALPVNRMAVLALGTFVMSGTDRDRHFR